MYASYFLWKCTCWVNEDLAKPDFSRLANRNVSKIYLIMRLANQIWLYALWLSNKFTNISSCMKQIKYLNNKRNHFINDFPNTRDYIYLCGMWAGISFSIQSKFVISVMDLPIMTFSTSITFILSISFKRNDSGGMSFSSI